MRRKLFTISIMQLLVNLTCLCFNYYISAFLFGIGVLYLIYRLGFRKAILPIIIFFIASIFIWNGYFVVENTEKLVSKIPQNQKIEIRGTVISKDIVESSIGGRESYAKIILENCNIGVNVLVNVYYNNSRELKVGDFVEAYGKFESPKTARNPRCFNYKEYLNSKGIFLLGSSERVRVLGKTKELKFSLYRYTDHIRDIIFSDVANRGSSVIGLVRGVVLGDKTGLDEEVYDNFRMFGTAHVLAVSGLHVGILLTLYRRIYRTRPNIYLTFLIIIVLIFYGTLTRWSPSVFRAVMMSLVYIASQVFSRDADLLTSLGSTSIISTCINPLVISSLGFQMSYLAILGIGFISPIITRKIESIISSKFGDLLKSQSINTIAMGISIYISVQILLVPYILQNFNYISPLGFLLNLPVTILAGLIVTFSIISIFFVTLGDGLCYIAQINAHFLIENQLITRFWLILILIFKKIRYLIDVIIWGLGKMMMEMHSFAAEHLKASYDFISSGSAITYAFIIAILLFFSESFYIALKRKNMTRIAVYFVVLICIFVSVSVIDRTPFDKANIVMVDVGQGDCMLVRSNSGINMIFDGGGSRNKNIGKLILKPYLLQNRIGSLDLAGITHKDIDHSKGVHELNKIYRINNLVEGAYAGEIAEGSGVKVKVLWPIDDREGESGEDNERSSVFRIDVEGISVLVTGDIGGETENKLIKKYKDSDLLKVDVLKIGHHGSKYSTSDDFLKAVNPQVALIGVGKNNYGHPSPSVIDKLHKNDIILYRTDVNGAIGLWKEGKKLKICTMLRE